MTEIKYIFDPHNLMVHEIKKDAVKKIDFFSV